MSWPQTCVQLARRMSPDEPSHNAMVIAAIPEEEIRKMTLEGLIKLGLLWQS